MGSRGTTLRISQGLKVAIAFLVVIALTGCGKGLLPLGGSGTLQISGSASHFFGAVLAQKEATASFTLTNGGQSPVTGLSGARELRAGFFTFTGGAFPGTAGSCTSVLAPGASCTIQLSFIPPRSGNYSGSVALGGAETSAVLSLTGDGLGGGTDNSFGASGTKAVSLGVLTGLGYTSVALQSDGKILLVDNTADSFINFMTGVARLTTDGQLDTTFGAGGIALVDIATSGSFEYALSSYLQPDGKLLVGGRRNISTMFVFRLTTQGTQDSTFGTNGIMTNAATNNYWAYHLAVAADSRIWIGAIPNGGSPPTLIRLNSDGNFDTTFDGDGILALNLGVGASVTKLIKQPDERLVVSGVRSDGFGGTEGLIARILTDGTLDPSFDGDGIATLNLSTLAERFSTVVYTPSGELVAGGSTSMGGTESALLARFSSNGALDSSFSGDGYVTFSLSTINNSLFSIGLQSDGKIVVISAEAIGRLSSDGALDTTFGTAGAINVVNTDFSMGYATQILSDPEGRLLVAGTDSISEPAVIRLMP